MPGPEDLGPLGAHLVGDGFGWCTRPGALRRRPRGGRRRPAPADRGGAHRPAWPPWPACSRPSSPAPSSRPRPTRRATAAAIPGSGRSSTSRRPTELAAARRCDPVPSSADRPDLAASLTAALEARSITCHRVEPAHGFDGAANALRAAVERAGPIDAVVVALAGHPPTAAPAGRLGAGAGRPPRDRRAPARRRRLGPGGRRLRRRGRPPGPARDPDRRHHHRRVAAGPRPRRSWPGSPPARPKGRVTAFAASIEAPEAAAGQAAGELVAHLLAHPEAARAGRRGAGGGRRLARPSQPPPTDRHRHLRRSRHPRLARRHASGRSSAPPAARLEWRPDDRPAHPRRRRPRAPLGPRPHRLVPVPRRIPRHGGAGDASGMYRRFDVDTYRAESARWNVEKFVNVAAATGPHSIDETIELDRDAPSQRRPRRHHRRPPADRHGGRGHRAPRPADDGAPLPRGPPDGRPRASPSPTPACSRALQERNLVFELMTHPDQLASGRGRARRLRRSDRRGRAHRMAPHRTPTRSAPSGETGIDALAGARRQRRLQALGPGHAVRVHAASRPSPRGSSTPSRPSASTAACSPATSPSTRCAGTFDELYTTFSAVTAGLDDASREKLFAGTAERVYRL